MTKDMMLDMMKKYQQYLERCLNVVMNKATQQSHPQDHLVGY